MLDQLKSLAIFASVADEGSFRGAAKKLTLSPSIVSVHIKKLEQQIGAPLFYRSTRQVTLTEDGRRLQSAAKTMISAARDGLDLFAAQAGEGLTELRVAMPDVLATSSIMETIAAFAHNHRGIRLNLISSDQQQSLIGEGHDVAIRMGYFGDSDLKSKRIGEDMRILVAAPEFVKQKPVAVGPTDIENWETISFSLVPDNIELKRGKAKPVKVLGTVVAKASSTKTVHALCLAGLGMASLPHNQVQNDLSTGRLVRVLPEWEDTKVLPIHLVWPTNAGLNLATREFINFMSGK